MAGARFPPAPRREERIVGAFRALPRKAEEGWERSPADRAAPAQAAWAGRWNCASSVEPASADSELSPPAITWLI